MGVGQRLQEVVEALRSVGLSTEADALLRTTSNRTLRDLLRLTQDRIRAALRVVEATSPSSLDPVMRAAQRVSLALKAVEVLS